MDKNFSSLKQLHNQLQNAKLLFLNLGLNRNRRTHLIISIILFLLVLVVVMSYIKTKNSIAPIIVNNQPNIHSPTIIPTISDIPSVLPVTDKSLDKKEELESLINLLKNSKLFSPTIQWDEIVEKSNQYILYNGNHKVPAKGYSVSGRVENVDIYSRSYRFLEVAELLQKYGWERNPGADANGPTGEVFNFKKLINNTVSLLKIEDERIAADSLPCSLSKSVCINTVSIYVSYPIQLPNINEIYELRLLYTHPT